VQHLIYIDYLFDSVRRPRLLTVPECGVRNTYIACRVELRGFSVKEKFGYFRVRKLFSIQVRLVNVLKRKKLLLLEQESACCRFAHLFVLPSSPTFTIKLSIIGKNPVFTITKTLPGDFGDAYGITAESSSATRRKRLYRYKI